MKPIPWILKFILLSILTLSIVGSINFILDPLQQYRKAHFYKPIYDNERYLNPGLAKTYEYNQVIIGSSMTENFILSDAKEILGFNKPIKFCMSGATAYEIKIMLDSAYQHRKIDSVIYGVDLFSFTGETTRLFDGEGSLPFYLYDNNRLNDYRYLLSFDTLKFFVDSFVLPKPEVMFDLNRMYQWQHKSNEDDFNGTDRLDEWSEKYGFNPDYSKSEFTLKALKANIDTNLIPLIQNHPETTFYLFYPPYSILAFKDMENKGWLNTVELFKRHLLTQLAHYPNVKIYDFQASKEVTCNLDNYKDLLHYHQRINRWMLEEMKKENYLTSDKGKFGRLNRSLISNIHGCGIQ
ncbi:MAG: hypothetical protein PHW18_07625 [Sulfuricurvum sp.]|uniref:hypothetical protein n=1 Tax=Sulfuricurvum sp. TaxID=2025608 RepID=UPI00263017CF|nr:hypothetical protein [Sulfuricurvum sp.]MDD2829424.1 hypothetical protein [Sulfuricurvum sp.]MDD4948214.1 hypothetical protein [Sulfuricurvum sp.]